MHNTSRVLPGSKTFSSCSWMNAMHEHNKQPPILNLSGLYLKTLEWWHQSLYGCIEIVQFVCWKKFKWDAGTSATRLRHIEHCGGHYAALLACQHIWSNGRKNSSAGECENIRRESIFDEREHQTSHSVILVYLSPTRRYEKLND